SAGHQVGRAAISCPARWLAAPRERTNMNNAVIGAQYSTGLSRHNIERAFVAAGKDLDHLQPEAALQPAAAGHRSSSMNKTSFGAIPAPGDDRRPSAGESNVIGQPPITPGTGLLSTDWWPSPLLTNAFVARAVMSDRLRRDDAFKIGCMRAWSGSST